MSPDQPAKRRVGFGGVGRHAGAGAVGYVTSLKPVKSIGRLTHRLYCDRCGQKLAACDCDVQANDSQPVQTEEDQA